MQIRRFYSPRIPDIGECLLLPEMEARHALKVLRLRPGERLLLLDGKGTTAEAELLENDRSGRTALCRILSRTLHPAPVPHFRLYVAPPHGKGGFDFLLKAATELGVARISPIICRHAVSKPEGVSESWQNVLIAACKQAIKPFLPQLDQPTEFKKALKNADETGFFGAVPDSHATPAPMGTHPPSNLALWIGPEGGFAPEEEKALLLAGCRPITLGRCVLRVETAVPALLGLIHGLLDNF